MFYKARAFFKRHARVAFAILVIIFAVPLVALFTQTDIGGGQSGAAVDLRVHGRKIDTAELESLKRAFYLKNEFEPQNTQLGASLDQQLIERIALLKESERLHIKPTPQQIEDFYRNYPPLQRLTEALMERIRARSPGVGEEAVAQQLQTEMSSFLNGRRLSLEDLDQFVREEITLRELHRLIAATAKVTPLRVRQAYEVFNETLTVDIVKIPATEFTPTVKVTDEEIQKAYDEHKQQFEIPQRVKVLYVKFPGADFKELTRVTEDEIKAYYDRNPNEFRNEKGELEPLAAHHDKIKEKLLVVAAARLANEQAVAFLEKVTTTAKETVKVTDADLRAWYDAHTEDFKDAAGQVVAFDAIKSDAQHEPLLTRLSQRAFIQKAMDIYAGAVGRKTEVTDYFPERGPVPKLEVERGFLKEAFSLGEAEPFSNAVRSNDDFYVLGFVGSKPPEIPALDAVKDQIQKILAARKAHEAALTAAEARSREVRETMEKGQSFADACAALNLKVVSPPPFSIFGIYSGTAEEVPHASGIIPRVDELETGEISQTIENADGAMFFHLRARQAVDSETFEKEKARFADLLWAQAWQSAYTDWRTVKVAPEISIKSSRRR